MAEDDARRTLAHRPGRTDVFRLTKGEEFSANKAGRAAPAHETNHSDNDPNIRAKNGNGTEDEKKRGKAKQRVDHAHKHIIDPSATVTAHGTDDNANTKRDRHGDKSYGQRDRGPRHHSREDITTEIIRAQPVGGTRRQELVLEPGGIGIQRHRKPEDRANTGSNRYGKEKDNNGQRHQSDPITQEFRHHATHRTIWHHRCGRLL